MCGKIVREKCECGVITTVQYGAGTLIYEDKDGAFDFCPLFKCPECGETFNEKRRQGETAVQFGVAFY